MKAAIVLGAVLTLTSCAGAKYAIDHYASVKPISFRSTEQAKVYRIYDKPHESRMMITPSIGASIGGGAVKGATFGALNTMNSEVGYRNAAEEFLLSTGRACRATDIALVIEPQYEIRYTCAPTAPQSPES